MPTNPFPNDNGQTFAQGRATLEIDIARIINEDTYLGRIDFGDTTGDGDGDTGVPVCGNGVVDLGEQCDGTELGGITCMDLGYNGGELACDPVTCTYDASGCMAGDATEAV